MKGGLWTVEGGGQVGSRPNCMWGPELLRTGAAFPAAATRQDSYHCVQAVWPDGPVSRPPGQVLHWSLLVKMSR